MTSPVPVVLVHGTRTSSAIWHAQVAALEAAGHPTTTIDLPGHGDRTGERFTWEGAVAAIDAAVDAHDAPPLLVGLSLGGYLSLAYAGRHGHRLAGLMLAGCSTEVRGKPVGLYRDAAHHVTRTLGLGQGSWHVVTDMLTAIAGYSPLTDLRRLRVPLWVVNGRRDPLRLDERRFLRAAPGARLTVVPGAGHDVNSHAPTAFNRVLVEALRELTHGVLPALSPRVARRARALTPAALLPAGRLPAPRLPRVPLPV
ncbi:alpha/beta fold hydrolase [Cellulomonas oligotrophica]|uniref:Pimeloyl-ACP methyl ester carboxylesterase n=1 Tax=Cellulomonas oligotrophica TaxID=931536 RepID=A0A7Y9FD26_9CELL|nr:alpha/beta hydrolase [Cellulomonas oligotrophica]NYD84914.1 pimeloyl-ACP methyl ester carboxylesterase [Cellulomonas oligotrophica]